MNYEKILDEFINEELELSSYENVEEVRQICFDTIDLISKNEDATPEEIIEAIIKDDMAYMEQLREQYPVPGYTIGLNVGNINVKYFGGNMSSNGPEMREDAMYDIASMTKMYTQVIMYNLMKEGYFTRDSKIKDLDPRFENLDDVTIGEIMDFSIDFATDGNITMMSDTNEVKEKLYSIKVKVKDGEEVRNKYVYTDFGMMIAKEVMENVTGKKYTQLFDEYIGNKLGLSETKIIIPEDKKILLTGSPNAEYGRVNDPKANAVGGYSGHAGIFASNDDIVKFSKGMEDGTVLDEEGLTLAKTPSRFKLNRGGLGNTYVKTADGLASSGMAAIAPNDEFNYQGSTRVEANVGSRGISNILFNPGSLDIEEAQAKEADINQELIANGKNPISIVKHFEYTDSGLLIPCTVIDPRQILPIGKLDPIKEMNARTSIKLRLLNKFISAYEPNYDKEISVSKKASK